MTYSSTPLHALLRRPVADMELVAQPVILVTQPLALTLQRLDITVPLLQLLLESTNLAHLTRVRQLVLRLVVGGLVATQTLDFLLEAQDVEDHHVGAVEDEGEEEGEAAEVHVALGVEFAGLDFHAFAAGYGAVKKSRLVGGKDRAVIVDVDLRGGSSGVLRAGQLDLDAVDAVHAVDEEDEDEDEGDLEIVSI